MKDQFYVGWFECIFWMLLQWIIPKIITGGHSNLLATRKTSWYRISKSPQRFIASFQKEVICNSASHCTHTSFFCSNSCTGSCHRRFWIPLSYPWGSQTSLVTKPKWCCWQGQKCPSCLMWEPSDQSRSSLTQPLHNTETFSFYAKWRSFNGWEAVLSLFPYPMYKRDEQMLFLVYLQGRYKG